jgi:hypothetical protein
MPFDVPEAGLVRVLPGVAGGDDVLMGAADEVPPHDQLLGERLAAEEEHRGALLRGQREFVAVGAEVEERASLVGRAVHVECSGEDEDRVLEVRAQRQDRGRAGRDRDLGADDRREGRGG